VSAKPTGRAGDEPSESPAEADNEKQVTPFSTNDGGKAPESVDNLVDPVKAALRGAQRISRGKPARTRRRRRTDEVEPRTGGYSGAGPDANDPQPVGAVVEGYLTDRGWQRPLAEARLFADWAAIVGDDVAAHCAPSALRDGELKISAESTAWATQLRMLQGTLLARIVAELGTEVVTRVVITGPVGPSWKHGLRSVHGARGPRDTYG
jgi:predicted nucleic acid-binding Zn ribbon protein